MKVASTTVLAKKMLRSIFGLVCLVSLPSVAALAQGGPPSAGNPDEVVPFDPNMNLAFLAIGLLFAGVVVFRQLKRNKAIKAA